MVKLQRSHSQTAARLACLLVLVLALTGQAAHAGCPFDDGSCQEYCNQQGCNLGYCGHFAWIQCICRKCGDEWNWYDKVHYNPDKQVNQTELDSLKLNASVPLILTNNNSNRPADQKPQQQQQQPGDKPAPVALASTQQAPVSQQQQQQQQQTKPAGNQQVTTSPAPTQKVAATLTTLLIPDLSDGSKLDLNDIPDENSEKFLDYLTKNHEKLVQATHNVQQKQGGSSLAVKSTPATLTSSSASQDNNDDETEGDESDADQPMTPTNTNTDDEPQGEETVEIQISSSNNNQPASQQQQQQQQQQQPQLTTNNKSGPSGGRQSASSSDDAETDEEGQVAGGRPVMRLLRMATAERSSD